MIHGDQIEFARLNSAYNLARKPKEKPVTIMPDYTGRNANDGSRSWKNLDGSQLITSRYLSNTSPESSVIFPGSIGRDGIAIQKPL